MSRSPAFSRLRALLSDVLHPGGSDALRIDRRRFVQLAVAAAATTPALGCGSRPGGRVVVVGGGIAGLHCAWRLADAGVDVALYEASDRVGGRMFTGRGLYPDGRICELGGELIDSNHLTLLALAEELDIGLDDRWAEERPGMHREVYWADGERVPEETIVAQFTQVAPTFFSEVTAADNDDDAFDRLDHTSLTEFLDTHVPRSQFPELHSVLDSAYRGEYGLENDEQSALNLLYLIDAETPDPFRIFGDSDERWHTHDGNDVFPGRIADRLGAERITLEAELVSVTELRKGYELTFRSPDGSTFTDEAEHVVFALPFTKLRSVELSVEMKPLKRRIIDELAYGTNSKVMGGFSRRVWWDDHNDAGTVTADLPFQQMWDTTIGQAPPYGILTNFLGGDQGVRSGEGTADAWFEGVLPDLEKVWPGITAAYDPGSAVRMHWPTAKWQLGSYTCYRPGQWAFWSFEGRRQGNLHFCGEHCSLDFQGWMEGAAETGGLVAAEILDDMGIDKPEALMRVVAPKLLVPQASYHGDLHGRLRWSHRRRQGWQRVRDLTR